MLFPDAVGSNNGWLARTVDSRIFEWTYNGLAANQDAAAFRIAPTNTSGERLIFSKGTYGNFMLVAPDIRAEIGFYSPAINVTTSTTLAGTSTIDGRMRVPSYANDTARNTAHPTPRPGEICFNVAANRIQAYIASSWVNLH
jgi:hypothetical protein